MPRILIDTSTLSTATAYPNQRKIVKTSTGKLVLFANLGNTADTRIRYKTSDDNGDTWSSWNLAYNDNDVNSFDVYIDTNNDILLAIYYTTFYYNLSFRKLTYSTGSWSLGSVAAVDSTSSSKRRPSITKRSNGDIWITRDSGGDSYSFYYSISIDEGLNWINSARSFGNVNFCSVCIPVEANIWVFNTTSGGGHTRVDKYDGSTWTFTNISLGIITDDAIGVVKISDTEIYVAGGTSSGIRIYKYNGSIWDSGTLLSDNATDSKATISNVNSKPVVCWRDYDGVNYNISYRKWNGSSWDAQVDLTSDVDVDNYLSAINSDLGTLYLCYTTGSGSPYPIYFDKVVISPTKTKTILSDAKIKSVDNQQTILSDAYITISIQKNILSDAKIKVVDVQETILSDAKIIDQYQETILSDAKILATGIQKTILSDAKICIQVLVDIINKVNFTKQVLYNINNKINTVIRVLSDVKNFVNICKLIISNIHNDFRTQKLTLNNVTNDVRFLYSWQKAADGTMQSLGKLYIKVYINGVEQTDVDIDSINISKDLNTAHTATFDLGRAYDATKPAMEATVLVKYNNWILYSGYITSISPLEDPEKIRINCQDEYWKQNKSNVYYNVGHRPQDNKELYYDTIKDALLTKHSWNLGIGNFTPQTINNFAVGKSDAITNLIQESGNYGWFYDINGNKKLWTAGSGTIINVKRQTLGENIKLYDLINHSFDESVESIVNKFRVQMGEKVIRKFNTTGGSRPYSGYNYSYYEGYAIPVWDSSYEILSINSTTGYGWDRHKPEDDYLYKDIYKKYSLPYLDSSIESWSDWKSPQVEIHGSQLFNCKAGLLESGYTIDYEHGFLILNDGIFSYDLNDYKECIATRAPTIKVMLWKRNYYSSTNSSSENPEEEVSNPLMFFTAKMGSYSDTIIKDLNLSNLSIQIGGTQTLTNGTEEVIPSWDDTNFAKDIANWELSKICDKKIKGTIEITLDATCFYGIDLTKRIYINGITDSAMNIVSMSYNLSNFTVTLNLENSRYFKRLISYQSHGE